VRVGAAPRALLPGACERVRERCPKWRVLILRILGEETGECPELLPLQGDNAFAADGAVEHQGEVAQRGGARGLRGRFVPQPLGFRTRERDQPAVDVELNA
jgi:hypothetical protein